MMRLQVQKADLMRLLFRKNLTHVFISKYDMTGIRKGSLALAEQVMSISTKCIIEKCGRVNKWSLDRVLKAVRIQMGMEGEGHDSRGI